jgi:5'-3' exonuclease
MNKLLLIDGDEFIFRATAALEREIKWDEDNHVLYANEAQAWDNLKGMLRRIFERFETDAHWLCFTTSPNFRTVLIDPTYKNNRVASRKPMCYAALRERVEGAYNVRAVPGLEADDVMGILATMPSKRQRIIVSQDKDMKTIPTTVWDGKDLHVIGEIEADYKHMFQTLVGDTSDGYKGCPKVGPVKAEKILAKAHDDCGDYGCCPDNPPLWPRVVATYKKYGLTETDALTQARLARILRHSDWDNEKKEPILWTPPSNSQPQD